MNHKDKRQIQTNENRERLDKTRQDKMASQEKTEGPDKDMRRTKTHEQGMRCSWREEGRGQVKEGTEKQNVTHEVTFSK